MRHRVFGKKLGRSEDLRRSLFRNLLSQLVLRGRVKTTVAKAKALKPLIDKFVSQAKNTTPSARRELLRSLPKDAAFLLIDAIAPRFKNRTSGFSRIIRLGERKGDNAEMVILEWTDQVEVRSDPSTRLRAGKLKVRKGEEKQVVEEEKPKEKKKVARKRKVVKKA